MLCRKRKDSFSALRSIKRDNQRPIYKWETKINIKVVNGKVVWLFYSKFFFVLHIPFETNQERIISRKIKKTILGFWVFRISFEKSYKGQQYLEKGLLIWIALLLNIKRARTWCAGWRFQSLEEERIRGIQRSQPACPDGDQIDPTVKGASGLLTRLDPGEWPVSRISHTQTLV